MTDTPMLRCLIVLLIVCALLALLSLACSEGGDLDNCITECKLEAYTFGWDEQQLNSCIEDCYEKYAK